MRHRFFLLLLTLALPAAAFGQADPVLDTGPVQTALLPNGFVGADNGAGTGFVFDGDSGLYEGQFLVGLGPDNVIGQPYSSADGAPPAEWASTGGVTEIPPPLGVDRAIETTFEAVSGEVAVRARAFATADDPYVILEYEVTNTSGGPLDEVYLGLFADWDVGDPQQNRGAFLESSNLLFVFDESEVSTNAFGTVVSDAAPVSGFSLSAETTDAGLYTALTTLGEEAEPAADRRTVLGVGPYALGEGERAVARFALAGGTSRSDLSISAGLVQEAAAGTVLAESLEVDGLMRDYLLFVPFGYDGVTPVPLVLNYHGYLSSPGLQMDRHSLMNTVADEEGFLIAYPQGLVVRDLIGDAIFTQGDGWVVPGITGGDHDDIAFTKALIDQVSQDFRVDPERVHATGWNSGGEFSYRLACTLPTRIASVASVAGPMSDAVLAMCTTNQRVSTMLIQGTADPFFPFDGTPGFYPSATATPAFWAEKNGCDPTPITTALPDLDPDNPNPSTVTRLNYTGCEAGTVVLFYRVDDGGLGWPPNTPDPTDPDDCFEGFCPGPTNQDINGSREIWVFFEENPLVVSNEDDTSPPTHAALDAAYPNPVARATTLGFTLPAAEHVRLAVHDVLGRRVAVVLDEVRPAGTHEVRFDAGLLASGAYLVRLQAGAASLAQRFVVVR